MKSDRELCQGFFFWIISRWRVFPPKVLVNSCVQLLVNLPLWYAASFFEQLLMFMTTQNTVILSVNTLYNGLYEKSLALMNLFLFYGSSDTYISFS